MDDVPQDPDQLVLFNLAELVGEILAALPELQRARVLDQLAELYEQGHDDGYRIASHAREA